MWPADQALPWTSTERHGAMTGIMKAQIDWIPLNRAEPSQRVHQRSI